jgi:hypothetical protein
MELSTVLQILNVVFLALFSTAGWRMVNEWRKSREERHRAELALRDQRIESYKTTIESLKTTHQNEIEKRALEITRLDDENRRLSQNRDEHIVRLGQHIEYLKAQASAGVSANFDAIKKLHAEELSMYEKKLQEHQSALSEERSEHQVVLKSKDILIEQLQAGIETSTAPIDLSIGLQSITTPPTPAQHARLERDREAVRRLAREAEARSVTGLICALGHWDCYVREMAAQKLASRGDTVVPELVAKLGGNSLADSLVDRVLKRVDRVYNLGLERRVIAYVQRFATIIHVLAAIGDPAVPQLNQLLLHHRDEPRVRAMVTLRRINTDQANEVLERESIS